MDFQTVLTSVMAVVETGALLMALMYFTVANEACDNGRISVNGRVVKASYDVKVGDKIEISMGTRTVAVEVLEVADNVRKDDAAGMYKEI